MFLNAFMGGIQVEQLQFLYQSHVINDYQANGFLTFQAIYQTVLPQTVLQTPLIVKYFYLNSFKLIFCVSV